MKYIGAHVSTDVSLAEAPLQAAAIGAAAFAFATAPTDTIVLTPLDPAECQAFKDTCSACGYTPDRILPHSGFMMNLGSDVPARLGMSRRGLVAELQRCADLGLTMLNFHPGATLGRISDSDCLQRIAESINIALDKVQGVKAVIENTAGQGSNLGWRLEHLATIIDAVDDKNRVGVCIDTCHALAAGYDLTTQAGYDSFWQDFDDIVGASRLCGMHLNDSKRPTASRIDRHEAIGKGHVGVDFFRRLLADPRTDGIPLILETPDPLLWAEEIRTLYGYSLAPAKSAMTQH